VGVGAEELAAYDSVRLFRQCAQQASPTFDLGHEARHVVQICRLVDGMPLAIEVAAAWLRLLPCARIAESFMHELATLASPLPNMPPRHRSMHFVLSHSWQMLSTHEAATLEALAIFQGGFDDSAAIEIAETDLLTLAALAQKSMIRLKQAPDSLATGRARYTMHEMLRQFADAQAAQHPAARKAALQRHSRYYLQWLHELIPPLLDARQSDTMALIDEDFANVRAAWLWATEHQDFALLAAAMDGIFHYCHIRLRILDGVLLLKRCADQLQPHLVPVADDDPAQHRFWGMLHARMGGLYTNSANPEGLALLQQSLEYLDDPCDRAFVLAALGGALTWRGELTAAEAPLHESLMLSRECGDLLVQGNALFRLCIIASTRGDYQQALALAREGLVVFRALGRPSGIAHMLVEVGHLETILGNYEAGAAHAQESLPISRRLGYAVGEVFALRCLGLIAWGKGELEKAVAYMQEALAIQRSNGVATQIGYALVSLAEVLNDCGVPEQVLQYSLESVTLARTLQNKQLLYDSLYVLGGAQIENGDFLAAHRSLMESLSLAWSSKDLASQLSNLYAQSNLLVRTTPFHTTEESVAAYCQALEWLVLLQYHPSCWQVYKDKAARLASEIAATLPAAQVAVAQERGKALSLDEVIQSQLQQT
jgi:tetratricopeptide (TPR) repeat protein